MRQRRRTLPAIILIALFAAILVWLPHGLPDVSAQSARLEIQQPTAADSNADDADNDADDQADDEVAAGDASREADAPDDANAAGADRASLDKANSETGDDTGGDAGDAGDERDADANADNTTGNKTEADDDGDKSDEDEPEKVSLAFKNMSMEKIAQFLNERLDKPVFTAESVQDIKLTIVATKKMPFDEAMLVLRQALGERGVIIEETPRLVNLRSVEDVQQVQLRLLDASQSLDEIEDSALIVRKVFNIEHYNVMTVKDAILPMLPDYGHLIVDPNTRQVIVTATVSDLMRIREVISRLDVPTAGSMKPTIIQLEQADATWVVSILRVMLSDDENDLSDVVMSFSGGSNANAQRGRGRGSRGRGGGNEQANVVSIEKAAGSVLLMPEVTRNWIIAVAPSSVMSQIETWVEYLDQPEAHDDDMATFEIEYANMEEIAEQVVEAVESAPSLRESVRVIPFMRSRKLMVFGSRQGQEFIARMLDELDVEDATSQVMEVIQLRHADAETVATNIEALFSNRQISFQSNWGTRYNYNNSGASAEVKVVADDRLNTVIVTTDASTLAEIKRMVREEWDVPLDEEAVQPEVYVLEHADPDQVQAMLQSLFGSESTSVSWFSSGSDSTSVGPLQGQFAFQTMPDSNVLVVTTRNADNYRVIDRLIEQLDVPQDAGLPEIIELNHANAEDMAAQLNAIIAEPGTLAELSRQDRGLSDTQLNSIAGDDDNNQNRNQGNNQNQQGGSRAGVMQFWWQQSRNQADERPTSNLVGKIRVVPVYRNNAIMVMCPSAYREPMTDLIDQLDQPGKQVIIHTVIAEVEHEDASTLGLRLASDPTLLGDSRLVDQAIGLSSDVGYDDLFGGTFNIGGETFGRGILNSEVSVNALIQLLQRRFDLNVLFEPRVYTADNQEADFFVGSDVSIQTESQLTSEGTLNRSFRYEAVGTRLRVRPHIAQNNNVALTVNLEVSRIVPSESTFGNPLFDRRETSTRVVVQDGQTVMLSGIVRQEDLIDVRKLPLLGDIPLIGGLFRSEEKVKQNRELLVFLTPQVLSTDSEQNNGAMEPYRERLRDLRRQIHPPSEEDDPDRLGPALPAPEDLQPSNETPPQEPVRREDEPTEE